MSDHRNSHGSIVPLYRLDAEQGSRALHDACQELFFRFERKHGLEKGEGRVLLLDTGVRL